MRSTILYSTLFTILAMSVQAAPVDKSRDVQARGGSSSWGKSSSSSFPTEVAIGDGDTIGNNDAGDGNDAGNNNSGDFDGAGSGNIVKITTPPKKQSKSSKWSREFEERGSSGKKQQGGQPSLLPSEIAILDGDTVGNNDAGDGNDAGNNNSGDYDGAGSGNVVKVTSPAPAPKKGSKGSKWSRGSSHKSSSSQTLASELSLLDGDTFGNHDAGDGNDAGNNNSGDDDGAGSGNVITVNSAPSKKPKSSSKWSRGQSKGSSKSQPLLPSKIAILDGDTVGNNDSGDGNDAGNDNSGNGDGAGSGNVITFNQASPSKNKGGKSSKWSRGGSKQHSNPPQLLPTEISILDGDTVGNNDSGDGNDAGNNNSGNGDGAESGNKVTVNSSPSSSKNKGGKSSKWSRGSSSHKSSGQPQLLPSEISILDGDTVGNNDSGDGNDAGNGNSGNGDGAESGNVITFTSASSKNGGKSKQKWA